LAQSHPMMLSTMVLAAASAGDLVTDAPLVVVVVDVWVDAGHDEDLVRKVCQLPGRRSRSLLPTSGRAVEGMEPSCPTRRGVMVSSP